MTNYVRGANFFYILTLVRPGAEGGGAARVSVKKSRFRILYRDIHRKDTV